MDSAQTNPSTASSTQSMDGVLIVEPSKMLALSFLVLIGFVLVVEGFGKHIEKGYVYFALAFSVGVEVLNIRARSRSTKGVALRERYARDDQ